MNTQMNFYLKVALFLLLVVTQAQQAYAQPISGSWSSAASSGLTPRYGLASAVINGRIYVTGGVSSGTILNTLEVFDPPADQWNTPETIGNPTSRALHTASVVSGKMYLIGGLSSATSLNNSIDVLDPAAGTWTSLTTSGSFTPRWGHCAAVVGNQIYVFGGDTLSEAYLHPVFSASVQVLDLSTNRWSTLATTGRFVPPFLSTCNVVGDKIYFAGGTDSTGLNSTNILEIFDPQSETWSIPNTQGTFVARSMHASAVIGSNIFVIGGYGETSDLISTQVFDPSTNTWYTPTTTGAFTARDALCASVVNNNIYAMGGGTLSREALNVNEVFTLSSSSVTFPEINSGIELFPNPAANRMTARNVGLSWTGITLFDALGRKVLNISNDQNAFQGTESDFELDVHALPNGSYFMDFRTMEGDRVEPFTVLH